MTKTQLEKWRAAIAALPSKWQKWDGDDVMYEAWPCFFCRHWEADGCDMDCTHPLWKVRDRYADTDGPIDSPSCWGFQPRKFANGPARIENLPRYWENLLADWAQQDAEREAWERAEADIG